MYNKIVDYYDEIMSELEYIEWVNFTKKYVKNTSNILDLGCGTGTFIELMSMYGYSVDGLDISSSMLDICNRKLSINHISSTLYEMDMTNFVLDKKYDCTTLYFDSLNHLSSISDVKRMFDCVYNCLNDNGLFIFDIFSMYTFKHCNYVKHVSYSDFDLKIKVSKKDKESIIQEYEVYDKILDKSFNEIFIEYFYDNIELLDDRFELVSLSGDFTDSYNKKSQRLIYVLKKKVQ
ncbi:MAG: class I SAM-dependent DNA methyltransferase [Anaeroplasmataceae bacterium]